ncbi:MAG TPA: hypothetical protein PLJ27_18175 [Polyangiaceae bacterium]|nr:hypothetical protein [Polyangiaceae bacterium]
MSELWLDASDSNPLRWDEEDAVPQVSKPRCDSHVRRDVVRIGVH